MLLNTLALGNFHPRLISQTYLLLVIILDSPDLSVCALVCHHNDSCAAAVFDSRSNKCYKYVSELSASTAEQTDYILLQERVSHPATTTEAAVVTEVTDSSGSAVTDAIIATNPPVVTTEAANIEVTAPATEPGVAIQTTTTTVPSALAGSTDAAPGGGTSTGEVSASF